MRENEFLEVPLFISEAFCYSAVSPYCLCYSCKLQECLKEGVRGMKRQAVKPLICILSAAISAAATMATYASPSKAQLDEMEKIVGYFPEWGIYSGHSNYVPAKVPFDKITHINYAFATIKNGVIANFDNYAATEATLGEAWDSPYKGNLGQFKKLKKAYPHLSVMVSIGGWTQSGNFHDVAATEEARDRFAASAVQYIRRYDFDGVDIDWEYPGKYREPDKTDNSNDQGTPKADASESETFVLLLRTLREYLDRASAEDGKYYQLTAAVGASFERIEFTPPSNYAQYLDFINLMTYDMHGAWDMRTNHQSALYTNPAAADNLNVDAVVGKFLSYGVDPKKLVVGTPFYSRGWKGVIPGGVENLNGFFSLAMGGARGIWDGGVAAGVNPYYHIVEMEKDPFFVKYYDDAAKAPYLYSERKQEMYTYEDKQSLSEKVNYVKSQGLGGIIIWELSADLPVSSENSLLKVIADGFYPGGIHLDGAANSGDEQNGDSDRRGDQGSSDQGSSDDNTAVSGGGYTKQVDTSGGNMPWNAASVYVGGDLVIHEGKVYRAKWWTQGDMPGAQQWGPWEIIGASNTGYSGQDGAGDRAAGAEEDDTLYGEGDRAAGAEEDDTLYGEGDRASDGTDDKVSDSLIAQWNSTSVYVGGDLAIYEGQMYRAKWWTRGDIPGAQQWGPWEAIDGSDIR